MTISKKLADYGHMQSFRTKEVVYGLFKHFKMDEIILVKNAHVDRRDEALSYMGTNFVYFFPAGSKAPIYSGNIDVYELSNDMGSYRDMRKIPELPAVGLLISAKWPIGKKI